MRVSCTVCYELFIPSDDVHAAPCGHILHLNCWSSWLQRSLNCPDCREPTRLHELTKLFFNVGEGDDYTTLNNKYDALRCDLSCKTKDCEAAERKLQLQTEEVTKLRQQIETLKIENEALKKNSGNSGILQVETAALANFLSKPQESESVSKRNKELAEEVVKLKKMAEELRRSATYASQKKCNGDNTEAKRYETIVNNLRVCLPEFEEIKKNSDFLKSLRAYTDDVDSSVSLWDDVEDNPGTYVHLFKDVKKYLEQKERRDIELLESPLGCVLELRGFPKPTTLQWRDIRAVIVTLGGSVAFITYNPGDKIAYVRLQPEHHREAPARKLVKKMGAARLWICGVLISVRALEGQEELDFLRKSLEDRDRRNRERFLRRRSYDVDEEGDEESLLDETMRMVGTVP